MLPRFAARGYEMVDALYKPRFGGPSFAARSSALCVDAREGGSHRSAKFRESLAMSFGERLRAAHLEPCSRRRRVDRVRPNV